MVAIVFSRLLNQFVTRLCIASTKRTPSRPAYVMSPDCMPWMLKSTEEPCHPASPYQDEVE